MKKKTDMVATNVGAQELKDPVVTRIKQQKKRMATPLVKKCVNE